MDFIKGADVSSLLEVERCGGTFQDGDAPEEAFSLLRRFGINGIRLRLWNDPYDAQGNAYGGGVCDLPTVLTLARRSKNAGMQWMLAPHFSDFWVDPGRQTLPKAWRGFDGDALEQAVYQYTKDILCACRAANVIPDWVQVGNELSCGLLWPSGKYPNWEAICRYISAGVRAVREQAPHARAVVHLDHGGKNALYREWFDNYFRLGGDCDIIGLSFYPSWHGKMADLAANLNDLSTRYQKDLLVVEAGTVFSQESYAAYEHLPEDNRKGTSAKPEMVKHIEYPMTPDGQASYIRDLISVLRAVPGERGKGFFWWEAAWLPVPGSGWAKRPGWEYLETEGPEGNEWANQTLFDYDGRALPALSAIRDA